MPSTAIDLTKNEVAAMDLDAVVAVGRFNDGVASGATTGDVGSGVAVVHLLLEEDVR